MSGEKLPNNVHLFQNFDDEYEINQSAKEIAMGLLMGMADKETGLKIPKNRVAWGYVLER
jgi:hypothetical protein